MNTPRFRFLSVMLLGFALTLLCGFLALDQPQSENWQIGDLVTGADRSVRLQALDFVAEPGEIYKNSDLIPFYSRQNELAEILANSPRRHLFDLPLLFWIQIFVGLSSLLIATWIWALRPGDLPSRLFFVSSLTLFAAAATSAVYTTRSLALPAPLFRILAEINSLGSTGYCVTVIGMFLVYPIRLARWRAILSAITVFYGTWILLYTFKLNPEWSHPNLLLTSALFVLCAVVGWQFKLTAKKPEARAVLTWLGLSVIVGAGGFVLFNSLPLLLGLQFLPQGYAFLFFVFIYLGLAAGLAKYRLFEVGHWAFRFLFYAVGAASLLIVDAVLISLIGMDRMPALGLSLLAVGLLYLPFRDAIWGWFSRKSRVEPSRLLSEALDVALAPTGHERSARWKTLLKKNFDPLEMIEHDHRHHDCLILNHGIALAVPSVADTPALKIIYPRSGSSLFSLQTAQLANQLVHFIRHAETSRSAYDRGVSEERKRMAQDLHDDVGSRLLTTLYTADEKTRPALQEAIADIRAVVKGISGERMTVGVLVSDLRFEISRRAEVSEMKLDWTLPEGIDEKKTLDYHQHKAITSSLREIFSNIVRHAHASRVQIAFLFSERAFEIIVRDNGCGFSLENLASGNGLKNLKRRMSEIDASTEISSDASGTIVKLSIPYELRSRTPLFRGAELL